MQGYLIAIIVIVLIGNAFLVFWLHRRNRNEAREARENRIAASRRNTELIRRNEQEQEDAAKRVELRNKTLKMFEQVRKHAEAVEHEAEINAQRSAISYPEPQPTAGDNESSVSEQDPG